MLLSTKPTTIRQTPIQPRRSIRESRGSSTPSGRKENLEGPLGQRHGELPPAMFGQTAFFQLDLHKKRVQLFAFVIIA